MPFGLWVRIGPGNHVLDGGSDPPWEQAILGKGSLIVKYRKFLPWAAQKQLNRLTCHLGCGLWWAKGSASSILFARWHQRTRQRSTVSCAKTAEPIDLPFGLWTRVVRRKHKFNHIRQVAPMCPYGNAHLAPPSKYDWTICLWRRCGLMSNYFDHLLKISPHLKRYPTLWNVCSRNCHTQELCEQTAMQHSNCHARFINWKIVIEKNTHLMMSALFIHWREEIYQATHRITDCM